MLFQRPQIFAPLSLLLMITLNDVVAAQPLGQYHQTVEALIAPAEFVAIGSVKSVKENVIVVPGSVDKLGNRDDRGKFEYVIKTRFTEVLKKVNKAGDDGEFEKFRTIDPNAGKNEQLARWAKNGTKGLWLIHPKYQSEKFHRWQFIPFFEQGIDHFGYRSSSLQPPMFASDLSILPTHKEILRRIKEYSPISQMEHDPGKTSVASIRIPPTILGEIKNAGSFHQLSLPIDSQLPKIARRLIESPSGFVSRAGGVADRHSMDTLREAGIDLLGAKKTDSSLRLLKDCMDDSIVPFKHSSRDHRIRTKAFEKLLDWRVNLSRPKFSPKVTRLLLSSTNINDDTLTLVSEFENLETLYLWDTKVSHVGIAHLAKLKKLKLIALDDQHLTLQMLRTLRKNKHLHLISQATTENQHNRPSSILDVAKLKFWYAPFGDSGLKEFSDFKNVTLIDVGRMKITDAGIEHLAKFKKLKNARLRETSITKEGATKLRKALPKCSVELR